MYSNAKKEAYCANHVFLENGQCDRDFWVPLLLTVDVDDEVEFERILWELELVDEQELRLVMDTWPPLGNTSITQGLRLFLSNDSKDKIMHIFTKLNKLF